MCNLYSSGDDNPKKGCLCKDENYVSGPDTEPAPGWCVETVNSTANFLEKLVRTSRLSKTTQESIIFALNQQRFSGLHCCARGERWKTCVGPLMAKPWCSNRSEMGLGQYEILVSLFCGSTLRSSCR